jgi:endonuclease/exonuclease/phosphatase (EEP) superfamily protein YafD
LLRAAATVVGVSAVFACAAGVFAHYSGFVSSTASRVAAFTPVLVIVGVVGFVVLLLARRWIVAGIAALVVVAGVVTQAPLYVGASSAADSDLVVMQANIYLGQADIVSLASTVRAEDVDLLTIVELTEGALNRIEVSDLAVALPYSFTHALPDGRGVGIFSKYPLVDGRVLDGFRLGNVRAETDLPGHGRTAVYALHPLPPWPEAAWRWDLEMSRLSDILAAEALPTIVGADMNSTWDHRPFRRMLAGYGPDTSPDLLDAAEVVGAGFVPTYPADKAIPPLLTIDHVLTRGGLQPTSMHTVTLVGSDHRGVVATVR